MKSKLKVLGVLLVSTMVFFACSKDEDKPMPQPTEKVVKFADANFKKVLLENTELNTNKDNEIQEKEALAFTGKINVKGKGLTNLTDLQFFPNITELDCSNNNLTTLNLSKNTKLTAVYCQHNKIKGAETTTATKGQTDEKTIWTLSVNTELKILDCSYNQLVNIDLSKNTKLENVDCSHNIELVSLNVANGNNAVLKILNATNTPKLKTILVDEDKSQNPPKEWKKDENTNYNNQNITPNPYIEFTTYLNEMRLTMNSNDEDKANVWIDLNKNGVRDNGEEVTTFDEEVSYIVNKQTIRVYGKITVFNCYSGGLTYLNVENSPELIELECGYNTLKSLNVSKNKKLVKLGCDESELTGLNVDSNLELTHLKCDGNEFTSLNITNNSKLKELRCENNQLESLDVSKKPELTLLWCEGNKLKNLNIENNSKLNNVKCGNNKLSSLIVNNNTELKELRCESNQLKSLNVDNNIKLTLLWCFDNQLSALDV